MRRIVAVWSALATALLAATIADGSSEWLTDRGVLQGTVRDTNQESLLPAAILASVLLVTLVLYLLIRRVRGGGPALGKRGSFAHEAAAALATLGMTFASIVLMEGYETQFGGASPFDVHAVLVAHAGASIAACIVSLAVVRWLVGRSLRAALRAGSVLAQIFSRFVRRMPGAGLARSIRLALGVRPAPYRGEHALRSNGFRAPPFPRLHVIP